jgi:hypothetical protein
MLGSYHGNSTLYVFLIINNKIFKPKALITLGPTTTYPRAYDVSKN